MHNRILRNVIRHLSAYRLVILGDRELCSVKLGQWLAQQKVHFCLRLQRNTKVAVDQQFTQQLQNKRHSAFRVRLSAYLWAITGDGVLARLVDELMKPPPNKLPEYQRGMRAMELVCAGL